MKSVQAKAKSGKTLYLPVFDAQFEAAVNRGNVGHCVYCGEDADGVEPDARRYTCEGCRQSGVYGLEELVMMGWVR